MANLAATWPIAGMPFVEVTGAPEVGVVVVFDGGDEVSNTDACLCTPCSNRNI